MTNGAAINRSMGALEWGMVILLSLVWGGSFFFNEIAVRELPPLTVVVGRVVLASLILLTLLRFLGQRIPTSGTVWRAFFVMGFLNNVVPFTLIVWGQIHIASGVASILNATTPLFTVLVAHWMTADEKITKGRVMGVFAGLAGVAVMIGGDALTGLGVNVVAQLAVLAGALSYAFAGVYGRRFRALEVSPMATATGQVTASSVMLVPVMLIVDQPWLLPMPSAAAIGSLIGVAALSTAVAYILYFRILATAGATNLLLVTFLIPVSAVLLGVLILGEVLLPKHLTGMALIGLGLAAIDGRPWRFLRSIFAVKA
ncbi:DMT family transporter [Denitrobaculum tricleocarpae]|uniref:DMT family transporter n=1 Tax=Denitrobaculum tricleocarpae TaxID=2591009 RepID=A0A545TKQ8_9PROT|nr:DMT family transporter [Denitrobaculum tricleocarpae]TQV77810.1 DMT family transporter [Denitrobaculum tricleocarpae]